MEKREQLYEGKAKKVFATDDADLVIVDYKDDATAGDGAKKGTIRGKGVVNNRLSNNLMKMLAEKGVPTHFVEELSDRETLVKKVEIVPLEVIIRNVAAGSFTKRLGVPEGTVLKIPTIEFSYKNDEYHDPLINHYHALALGLATQEEIDTIRRLAFQTNDLLRAFWSSCWASTSASSTSSWNSAACPTAPSCWPTRSAPTPAASGTPPQVRTWIKTCSGATWAAKRKPTGKL